MPPLKWMWPALQSESRELPPGWDSGPRLVSSNNLILIRRGVLLYHGVGESDRFGPSEALFVPRGVRHVLMAGPRGCHFQILRIRLSAFGLHVDADAEAWELVVALSRQVHRHGPRLALPRPAWAAAVQALERIEHLAAERGPGCRAMIKGEGLLAIARVARAVVPASPPAGPRRALSFDRIRRVIEHVERNYQGEISVPALARIAGLSRSHFHAAFRDYTGLSPTDYLLRVRIGEACRRLRDSSDGVLTVAYDCGFASLSSFYEAFAKVVGEAPGRWRRRASPGPGPHAPAGRTGDGATPHASAHVRHAAARSRTSSGR